MFQNFISALRLCLYECDLIYRPRRRPKRELELLAVEFGRAMLPLLKNLAAEFQGRADIPRLAMCLLGLAFAEHREKAPWYPKPGDIALILERLAREKLRELARARELGLTRPAAVINRRKLDMEEKTDTENRQSGGREACARAASPAQQQRRMTGSEFWAEWQRRKAASSRDGQSG